MDPTVPRSRLIGFALNFAELAAPATLEVLEPLVRSWAPDLLLHDAAELAGPLVAATTGLPSVCLGFGEVVPAACTARAGEVIAQRWAAAGLTPDPHAGSYRGLYVDLYPPSLRSAPIDHIPRVQPRRPAEGTPESGPLVYVTFGTVFNAVDEGFRAAVLGVADVAEEVLVTVGHDGDPAGLGPLPGHVTVEPFVPQAEVLPRCAAVVCHGGSGTLLASLAHGLPLLCLPRGADQFDNAANLARVGAGVALRPPEVTQAAVRAAMTQVLACRPAAEALGAEIADMPSDADVAAAIEAFAALDR